MALFSRRKKSEPVEPAAPEAVAEEVVAETAEATEAVPEVSISVQAYRGVGAEAGPSVAPPLEVEDEPDAAERAPGPSVPTPELPAEDERPRLPLAPAMPPEQTHTIEGLIDNVLLREALTEIEEGASNEQLLGVMRQSLQGHLYLRVHGDARQQLSDGQQLSVGVIRDGDKSFMLAFSSGEALRASVDGEEDPTATSAVAQPVGSIYQQVVAGGFTGIIIDNASGPHRVVFPTELLAQALEQGDAEMTLKGIVSSPREADSAHRAAEALAKTKVWVAVNDGVDGQPVGIAEAHAADGSRFLQVFSHPLEVVALGRNDRPMPFEPEQLAKVLSTHPEVSGVLIDAAGPSMVVERDALGPVLVLAVDIDD